jgi:hypothetical protein
MANGYNGWSNRATWLVCAWFEPESRDDVERARGLIEEAQDNIPAFMRDFLCTDEINWVELLEHFEEEEEEE